MIENKKVLTEEQKRKMIYLTNQRLEDNIYLLIQHHPFYATILDNFGRETVVDETMERVPVAAVSIKKGRPIRHTNPIGYMTYQMREQIFIDIHEILHITDLHHFRMENKDPGLWNIATDIEINQQLVSKIAVLPKDALMYYHFNLPEGLSAEEYYQILDSRDEPITLPPELQNTLLNDLITSENDENSDQHNNRNGNSKSSKAPGFEKLHPLWAEMASNSPDIQKAVIQNMVKDAMVRTPGNIPGEMKGIIERLFEPQLNWPRLLSTFTQSLLSTNKRNTWSRPSRKFGSVKMGTLRTKRLNLMVAIDTSASLKYEELAQFLAEINAMKDYAKITVVQCDTKIQSVEDLSSTNTDALTINGRGGTSFLPVFELASKRKIGEDTSFTINEKPDGIVYLTDGEGTAPRYTDIPTLWVLTPGGSTPNSETGGKITWGRFASLAA